MSCAPDVYKRQVVNRGGATAADVLELLRQVQQRVLEHSGIRLEPEIRLWD